MHRHNTWVFAAALAGMLTMAAPAMSAPAITGVSGSATNGSQMTISGSGFGSKPTAAPLVWETCPAAGVSSQWSGAWPNAAPSGNSNLQCRAPIRGVALPHGNLSMYMAGEHQTSGANAGYNVMAWKSVNFASYPAYVYVSW